MRRCDTAGFKDEEGAVSKGVRADSPLGPSEGTQPHGHLNFSLEKLASDC